MRLPLVVPFFGLCRRFTTLALAITCLGSSLHAAIILSEIDAKNTGIVSDADGQEKDWIELRNTGASTVNLAGWALSDDPANPGQWIFPSVNLAPGAHLLVFASGKDWRVAGGQLHTNFKLTASAGGDVILSQPAGDGWATVDALLGYPAQRDSVSYGRAGGTEVGTWGYLETPTPGTLNPATIVQDFVADTDFSVGRGYVNTAFTLNITSATPGATLVYTLDGSVPSLTNGTQVAAANTESLPVASLLIDRTRIVRAQAYKNGLGATNVDTHTYIFPANTLQQDASFITQPYANWGHDKGDSNLSDASSAAEADWAMDPRVTQHANPEDRCVASDFYAIPTVSVVMNWVELFGVGGIYIAGEGVDKPASFELINPTGNGSNPNATAHEHGRGQVRVFGGSSTDKRWKTDKLSFRFKFFDDFESKVLGDDAIGSYDGLVLDARLNQVWTQSQNVTQRNRGDYVRDAVMNDLENAVGEAGAHSQHVHLFLNGLYWGIYTLHERPDEHFASAYLGGDSDDYDVVKHGPDEENFLVNGNRINPLLPLSNTNSTAGVNYLAMANLAEADLSVQANYDALAAQLDVPSLIHHILLNFYGGNFDWAQHNWYATFNRKSPGSKWRFHCWDAEHVFVELATDVTDKDNPQRPDHIHQKLTANPEYRLMFADAAQRLLSPGGALAPEAVQTAFDARFTDINEAIRAESARWGDSGPQRITSPSNELHLRFSDVTDGSTVYASWMSETQRIRTAVLPDRASVFIGQLRARGVFPSIDAPAFSARGGSVPAGTTLEITNPNAQGTLYLTTDGSDPRTAWTGELSASAVAYTSPLDLTGTTVVQARVLANGEWSALQSARFVVDAVPAAAGNLVISQIHYHPANPNAAEVEAGITDDGLFEFFEVLNISPQAVSLDGLSVDQGLDITALAEGVRELAPGERALYVADVAAFTLRYGTGLPIAGIFTNGSNLSNGGERVHLKAADGSTLVDLTYDDAAPWPLSPDGNGPSLVLMRPATSNPNLGYNWRASTTAAGNPGQTDAQSYNAWALARIPASTPGYPQAAAPLADADADTAPNLLEYFLGTDPVTLDALPARPVLSVETLDVGAGPQTFAVFSFRYVRTAEGVAFTPQGSTNLVDWDAQGLVLLPPPEVHDDGTETRRYRSANPLTPDEAVQFFRLSLQAE